MTKKKTTKTVKKWTTEDEVVVLALNKDGDGFALVVDDDEEGESLVTLATDVAELEEMIEIFTEARDILLRLERSGSTKREDEDEEEEEDEDE